MLIMSYIGDQVWLMTSKHTDPDLYPMAVLVRGSATAAARTGFVCGGHGSQFINIRMEDAVNKTNARGLVRIRVG
jgi:hypothetical protein